MIQAKINKEIRIKSKKTFKILKTKLKNQEFEQQNDKFDIYLYTCKYFFLIFLSNF